MASVTVEKIVKTKIAPAPDGSVVLMFDGNEDVRIVLDMPFEVVEQFADDMAKAMRSIRELRTRA